MNQLIFEDKEESDISKMLKSNNINIIFSDGNKNLMHILQNMINYNKDDLFIVYVDVIPDNVTTIAEFNKLVKFVNDLLCFNVVIIPIPCIEYFCIQAWLRGTTDCELITEHASEYWLNNKNCRNRKLSIKSFEKYCKSILREHCDCLQSGKKFFANDCNCRKITEICDNRYTYANKCNLLYSGLPIITTEIENAFKISTVEELINVVNYYYSLYYKLTECFIDGGKICKDATYDLRRLFWC